ncbi:Acyl-CoA dehydrogenase/oxidase C-terminal [Cynara cardunculus var. scolymus]|uniref:Acyl-CoA dehydrogenase/oxidase C-terminal n=1 Tax=Cynara cardunculus var. scolymus TaxID=59895 RepID=A0A103XQ63_CYNCS|nr:Acyl-CoA dehydrogenase/oxidase C-terminal [Cynara cardunculus var. scolymus]
MVDPRPRLFKNVIDYKTQQSRLFPLLASAYAFRFVSEWLMCG